MASGKKPLCKTLQEKYAFTYISADQIVSELIEPNGDAYTTLRNTYPDFFTSDGVVIRAKMRDQLFTDAVFKQQIESLLHP